MTSTETNALAESDWWGGLAGDLEALPEPDHTAYDEARARQDVLTKPQGSLGRLEDFSCWLASWQGREKPRLDSVQALVFAGNHGITAQGISAFPPSVTAQMVENFKAGGAAICQLSEAYGAKLDVVALDLETPTKDMTQAPAMSVEDCLGALDTGIRCVADNTDLLVVGEMGIGNTSVAAALCHALLGGAAQDWVGPGTGLDPEGIARKAEVLERVHALHRDHLSRPFEALRRVGGREIAAMTGAILGARRKRIPVLLDGYVCTAAALVLDRSKSGALDHCLAGHVSAEPAHAKLLDALGMKPVLDLGMRLGEGTGAAVALGVLRGAVAAHNGMATFAEAQVDNRD